METISIVIPVFNSQDILPELHQQIADALRNINYQVIMINDGSRDESWIRIKQFCRSDPHVIGINLRKNSGQDNAIMAGLSYAQGEFTVIMDDDLQHNPHDIIKLLEACRKDEADVCFAHFTRKRQSWWKNIGSWLNGKLAEVLLKKPHHIYLSPFQIIRKEIIRDILKYTGPYPYIQGLIFQITDNVTQIEIEHHQRGGGRGHFNLIRSISVLLKHMTSFSVVPLRISSAIGFIVAFLGFMLSIYYTIGFFMLNNNVEGWTTLILVILVLGGLVLMSIGLIGEYLGRLYLLTNVKPQYSIKEVVRENDRQAAVPHLKYRTLSESDNS